jgi:hypothetical protein
MAYSDRNGLSQARRVLDRLAVDRKRTAIATCLLAVMAFMWVRVFLNRKPSPAAADTPTAQAQPRSAKAPKTVCYLKLPNTPGRNDYINRDFFAARDWECFRQVPGSPRQGPGTRMRDTTSNRDQEVIARVAHKMQLQAVLRDGNPRAFLNDQLLRMGDRFIVRDGPDTYEFEVLRIYEDSVLVGCNQTQVTLKLTQPLDVSK